MLLGEWFDTAIRRLVAAGVDSARFDAGVLAAHVLALRLTEVPFVRGRQLTADEMRRLDELLARRLQREPLQYVTGATEFYGHRFLCDPRALIPRCDTETLVEVALELIDSTGATAVLDIGTGTGVIALTLALERPHVHVLATDISAEALALAAANVALHDLGQRVTLAQGDCLEAVPEPWRERVQVLVCNPPYVRADELPHLAPEIRDHEPRVALVGEGEDATGLYARLVAGCGQLPALRALAFEVGAGQARAVATMLRRHRPDCVIMVREDLGGVERVVAATFAPGAGSAPISAKEASS